LEQVVRIVATIPQGADPFYTQPETSAHGPTTVRGNAGTIELDVN
jgi:hypothetical protein